HGRKKQDPVPDMVEHVVPGLVREDEKSFLRAHLLQQGVVDDYAFRSPETDHVRVELIGLGTGVHQKHALGRYLETSSARKLRQYERKLWLAPGQRFKLEEPRIDDHRFKKKHQQQNRQRYQPKVKPPAARTPANREKYQQTHDYVKHDDHRTDLAPIEQPGTPALNRLLKVQRKGVPHRMNRQVRKPQEQNKQRNKDKTLQKQVSGFALRIIAQPRGKTSPQNDQQYCQARKHGQEIQRVSGPRIGDRFLIAVVRKRIAVAIRLRTGSFDLLGRGGADCGRLLGVPGALARKTKCHNPNQRGKSPRKTAAKHKSFSRRANLRGSPGKSGARARRVCSTMPLLA